MSTVQLPSDVFLHIFLFLTHSDIARLRSVSKLFHDLSCEIELWRSAYSNASIPRPPGPFPWQSYKTLQDILIKSERLNRFWTSRPCNAVQLPAETNYPFMPLWTVQSGRLWRTCTDPSKAQLVCYNFEARSQQVVWEWDRPFRFSICLDASFEGQAIFIYVADGSFENSPSQKLMKCEVNNDGNLSPVSATWDVPSMVQLVKDISCRGSFVYLNAHVPVVLNTNSGTFYQVSVSHAQSKMGNLTLVTHPMQHQYQSFLLSETQLFCITHWCNEDDPIASDGYRILFQVFSLPNVQPSPGEVEFSELRVAHESVLSRTQWCYFTMLLRPFDDPATGSTKFKLLKQDASTNPYRYECLTITLPEPSIPLPLGNVLPLSFQSQVLFDADNISTALSISEDGYGRGYWVVNPLFECTIRTFSIDASSDVCHAVVGHMSTVYSGEIGKPRIISSDCFKGKFWVVIGAQGRRGPGEIVEIDID